MSILTNQDVYQSSIDKKLEERYSKMIEILIVDQKHNKASAQLIKKIIKNLYHK